MKIDDDWVDINLFSKKIVKLIKQTKPKGKYTYFNTGDQNAVFGFETPKNLKELKNKTGLKIEW